MDVTGRPFQPSIMFACKGKSLPQSGALLGQAPALLTIILSWKGLPGTNAQAYEYSQITDVKRFITSGPGANVIKLFTSVIYKFS